MNETGFSLGDNNIGYWVLRDMAGREVMTASMVEFPTRSDVWRYLMPVLISADRRYRKALAQYERAKKKKGRVC